MAKKRIWMWFLFFWVIQMGCTEFNPVTRKEEFIVYSTDKEVRLGSNIARAIEKQYQLVVDPLVLDRVDSIAQKIFSVTDRRDIQFFVNVIKAKEEEKKEGLDINAFALPGGYIFIFDGLIDFAKNDDEIACVIAHEVGHIVAKHGIKKLQAIMGYTFFSLVSLGAGEPTLAQGATEAFAYILMGYSRQDELLADRLGVRYAKAAGYKPQAMIDFLSRLQEKSKNEPLRPKSYLRSHPYTADRILAIKQELGLPLTFRDVINKANE